MLEKRYKDTDGDGGFNCAAPFRERLGQPAAVREYNRTPGFNCAAPFRERLGYRELGPGSWAAGFNCAAPFRERLADLGGGFIVADAVLQLCRPLSGAVRRKCRCSR